jgi:hypothetical protein
VASIVKQLVTDSKNESSATVMLDGVERRIKDLDRKEIQRAQLQKAERLGNSTTLGLVNELNVPCQI